MKDIRLLELPDGRILITTRPQGACGGRGIIGFFVIPSLEKLDRHSLQSAYVFQDQFSSEEWGGTNELHLLRNGKVGPFPTLRGMMTAATATTMPPVSC